GLPENQPSGTVVGVFSSSDPNNGDTFTYALVSGSGDSDNAAFTINGNQLQTAASFDYEARSSYSIRVRTTDKGELSFEKAFTITIGDVNEAPVLSGVPASARLPELVPYRFTAMVADPDLPADTLSFSLSGAPPGAAIDPGTGAFTWTPSEAQGPGSY